MSREADRIPVPTNGHGPAPKRRKPGAATETPAVPTAATPEPVAHVTSPALSVSVTPTQVAVGFGVIAGIILLVLGRRGGRGRR